MDEAPTTAGRTPLEIGAFLTFAVLAFAAVAGSIAVVDADHVVAGFGTGFGVASMIFLAGATIACALACLARGKLERVSVASIAAAGLATDMVVLAIWLDIDGEAYGKIAGVAFVWGLFALVFLGLALAVGAPQELARVLYVGTGVATILAGLVSTWLVLTGDAGDGLSEDEGPIPFGVVGDDELLRLLGVALVLMAALWFTTVAADRRERARGLRR